MITQIQYLRAISKEKIWKNANNELLLHFFGKTDHNSAMTEKRIDYIDYLKGLSIMLVVWYHTTHPYFLDFGFRVPLFFFASGIFFKTVPIKTYIYKKINQLLIPFVLFYIVYYIYLILQKLVSTGNFSSFDYSCFWSVFELYSGNGQFVVDGPLWFILALIWQQILTYIMVKVLKKRWLVWLVGIIITWIGWEYLYNCPTILMFGRSIRYTFFFITGHLYGRSLLHVIDSQGIASLRVLIGVLIIFGITTYGLFNMNLASLNVYLIWIFCLIIILVFIFKWIHRYRIAYPFWFYGCNSYIVLGLSEILRTIFKVLALKIFGEITIVIGFIQTILTLLCLWPIIKILNARMPRLVGKKPFIPYSLFNRYLT